MSPTATTTSGRRSVSGYLPPPGAPDPVGASEAAAEVRRWTITADDGSVVTGHLPAWAQEDPSADDIPAGRLPALLVDVAHWADFDGAGLRMFTTGTGGACRPPAEVQVFGSSIVCHPYPDFHRPDDPRIPVADVQITPDRWMTGLDPDDLTALAATLRTLAEHFENDVRPRLVAARADWAAHHAITTPSAA